MSGYNNSKAKNRVLKNTNKKQNQLCFALVFLFGFCLMFRQNEEVLEAPHSVKDSQISLRIVHDRSYLLSENLFQFQSFLSKTPASCLH